MPRARHVPSLVVVGLFALLAAGVIISGRIPHRVAYDQKLYHEEAIRVFAHQWPNVDVGDYLSATTPGFHLLLAAAVKHLHLGTAGLQVICALITIALLWLLGTSAPVDRRRWTNFVILLPFAASMYVFASGVWILPDNAAWLGVLAILLLALRPTITLRHVLVMGIALAGVVFIRQIHLWLAGVIAAAAWMSCAPTPSPTTRSPTCRLLFTNLPARILPLAVAALACLPAVLILIYFYGLWGGLVPPTFQFQYHSANAAGPTFILAVIGALSIFYIRYLVPLAAQLFDKHRAWALLATLVGLALGLIPRTTAGSPSDYAAGRRTGLWDAAAVFHTKAHLPDLLGHTSPLILCLCVLGSFAVASWLLVWSPRQRVILLTALAGYSAAFAAGGELWQRYAEPFALLFIILSALRAAPVPPTDDGSWHKGEVNGPKSRYRAAQYPLVPLLARLGPLVLAALFAALTARDLTKPDTRLVTDPAPPAETSGPGQPPPRPDSPWSRYMIGHQRHPAFQKK